MKMGRSISRMYDGLRPVDEAPVVDKMEIGNRIEGLLVERGESMKALSEEIGIDYQVLGLIKTGKRFPSIENLALIAAYFRVTIDYLLLGTESKGLMLEELSDLLNRMTYRQQKDVLAVVEIMYHINEEMQRK